MVLWWLQPRVLVGFVNSRGVPALTIVLVLPGGADKHARF
jgi:hypothetical protein